MFLIRQHPRSADKVALAKIVVVMHKIVYGRPTYLHTQLNILCA